jgi:hypothetical protein
MQVSDGNNHDFKLGRLVNDSVRKPSHLTAPDCAAERVPGKRKFLDSSNRFPCLIAKLIA